MFGRSFWTKTGLLATAVLGLSAIAVSQVTWKLLRPSNTGIPGEEVLVVRFGPDGRLWVGARWPFWREGGVGILDISADTWTTYANAPTGSGPGPMPSPIVNDIEFAGDGTVWFATTGGAVKYDGKSWTVYNSRNTPMAFDNVADISIATNGHVWLNNSDFDLSGDAIWEFDGSTWRSYRAGNELPWRAQDDELGGVHAASNGDVWVTNLWSNGAARLRGGQWTLLGASVAQFDRIVEDVHGNIWFSPGLNMDRLGKWDGSRFTGIYVGPEVLSIAADTDGTIYIGNWYGEVKRSFDSGATWQPFVSGLNQVYNIAPDPNGPDVWIGTVGAVGRFSGSGQWLKDYNTYTTGVPDYFLSDIHRGRVSGRMFVASLEAGVSIFDGVRWENRGSHNPNVDWPVLADGADSVYEDRFGAVWIGTNGVARWDGESFDLWDWRNAPFGVVNFWDFAEDANGTLFAFTKTGIPYRFEPATRTWRREPIQLSVVLGIAGAEADRTGNIYFAGSNDIAKWDGASWRLLQLPYSNFLRDLGGANDLAVAPDGTLWVGTQRGLVRYDGTNWTVYDQRNTPMVVTAVAGVAFREDGVMGLALSNLNDRNNCAVAIVDGPIENASSWHIFRYGQSPLPHPQLGDIEFDSGGALWVSAISEALAVIQYPSATVVLPSQFTVTRGARTSGGLPDLFFSDDSYLNVEARRATEIAAASVEIVVEGVAPAASASSLRFTLEAASSGSPVRQRIELFNFQTNQWEQLDERNSTFGDSTVEVTVTANPSRFIQPGTRLMRARIGYHDRGVTFVSWGARYDLARWVIAN